MEDNKTITMGMYRTIDLVFYTFIACVLEYINIFVFRNFFANELYTLSIVLPIVLICMMRWNIWALVPALLTGLVFCVANRADNIGTYLVYIIGNAFVIANMFWFKAVEKKEIQQKAVLKVTYTVTGWLLMVIGRTLISLIFEGNFIQNLKTFVVTEGLDGVIAIVIVLIAARQKDLFKDQVEYLKELQAERDKYARKKEETDND